MPGHEVVGVLDEGGSDFAGRALAPGTRAVIEPVLGCAPRHIHPLCPQCGSGHTGLCGNLAFGALEPGLQTGFCTDTGGGWSTAPLMAHTSHCLLYTSIDADEHASPCVLRGRSADPSNSPDGPPASISTRR